MTGKVLTAAMAAALIVTATFVLLADETAQAAGWRGGHFHHHHGRLRNAFGYYGTYPYDGLAGNYALQPAAAVPVAQRIDPVIAAVPGASCVKSRESITVPSEDGGTRTMLITRC